MEFLMADEILKHLEIPDENDPELDPAMIEIAFQKFEAEQSLMGGLLAGAVAALVGAGAWALITVLTGYQIGFIRQIGGKGISKAFGVMGAALALIGCLLGNFFAVVHFLAEAEQMGFLETLGRIKPVAFPELMTITFSPMDLLFYGIAVYEGYKLSFRRITAEKLQEAIKGIPAGM